MQYFLATLYDFDKKLTVFPYERYDVSNTLILFRDPDNAYQSKACLVSEQNDSSYKKFIDTEMTFKTFTAIYSLNSDAAMRHKYHFMAVGVKDRSMIGYTLSTPESPRAVALPGEIWHNMKVMSRLGKARKLWNHYEQLPETTLKDRITTALNYYLYSRGADREEERIINYCICLEALYVMDEREKSKTVGRRASRLLSPILWDHPDYIILNIKKLYDARNCIMHEGDYRDKLHIIEFSCIERYLVTSLQIFLLTAKKFHSKKELLDMIDKIEDRDINHIVSRETYLDFIKDESNIFDMVKEMSNEHRKIV